MAKNKNNNYKGKNTETSSVKNSTQNSTSDSTQNSNSTTSKKN